MAYYFKCYHHRYNRTTLAVVSISLLLMFTTTRNHVADAFATPTTTPRPTGLTQHTKTHRRTLGTRRPWGAIGSRGAGDAVTRDRGRSIILREARRDSRRTASTSSRLAMVASTQLEESATAAGAGAVGMNSVNAGIVNFLKGLMVQYYGERTYARFYALETIARVPYFGYLSVLHLYETLGQWRKAEYLKVHFAESYNELHHLLIMEELGGNILFKDRWFAQHAAFFYFFVVVGLYLANPRNAYNLNQHVEEHAYSTYDNFLAENEEELKSQPAPAIAKKYYGSDKLYVFNGLHNNPEGQTFEERDADRPVIANLFDTFVAVRNDEWEHVKTMKALQEDSTS